MRSTQSISVTLPNDLIQALDKMQKEESKSCSFIVSEAVRCYYERKQIERYRRELTEAGRAAGIITEEDIVKAVHETRRHGKKKKG